MKIQHFFKYLLLCFALFACHKREKPAQIAMEKTEIATKDIAETPIIDCNYTFEESVSGIEIPPKILQQLELVTVQYYSLDNKIHQGQVLVNQKIAEEMRQIFRFILAEKFPVVKVIPIVHYGWNDELSMRDNNSSAFCYRNAPYSFHSDGMAIDINPLFNPVVWKKPYENRKNQPENGVYDTTVAGTFCEQHPVVEQFKRLGFRWGKNFTQKADYHHFEKGAVRVKLQKPPHLENFRPHDSLP